MEKSVDLQRMFAPRSVAVIGASGNLESVSGRSLGYLKHFAYPGKVYPVNPKYRDIGGYPCYPDVTSLPEAPDVALIMVRAALVPGILKECAAKGIPYAIIYSSGFAESAQGDSQEELLSIARAGGMRILGPNCQGLLNLVDRVPLTFTGALHQAELPPPGHVAFISQSGAFGFSSYTLGRERGVGFRYIVTTGNQSDLDVVDCAHYVISDPEVRLLMMYLEGYNEGERFLELVRQARLRNIPVAVLKAGRSPSAQAAAQSHTAALTGDEAVWNAIFKQYCILPMEDVEDITAYGQIFGARERTSGNRVAVLTTSGGAGIVLADSLYDLGMEIPAFSEETQKAVAEHIPDFGSPRNPVDMTVQISNDPGGFEKVLDTVLDSGEVDLVINAVTMIVGNSGKTMAEVIRSRYGRNGIPQAVTWLMDQDHGGEFFSILRRGGVPFYRSLRGCARAVKALASWSAHCACQEGACEVPLYPEGSPRLPSFPKEMTEYDAKKLLDLHGIPITREALCQSMEEAFDAAEEIGYPVALKVMSPDILHKTEAGCIALNITSLEEMRGAYKKVRENAGASNPEARIQGFLVQQMVRGGLECIVGVKRDTTFGPMVAVGLGGIYVEVLRDIALRRGPVTEEEALEMIRQIKGAPFLFGARKQRPLDVGALANVVSAASRLAWIEEDLQELDINPVFVLPEGEGALAGDALVIRKK